MNQHTTKPDTFLQKMKGEVWLSLLENIPGVCFFLKDKKGHYMAANRDYTQYLGVSATEKLIGKTDFDFHPEEVAQTYVDDDQKIMQSEESLLDLVEPWSTVDGRFGWTVTSKHPVYDHTGEVIGVVGITRPSESESTSEESSEDEIISLPRYLDNPRFEFQAHFLSQMKNQRGTRALFENLPGVLFYIKDRDRKFIAANRPFLNRLGLTSENNLIGTTDLDHFPPDLATGFASEDHQVLETGNPIFGRIEQLYNNTGILDWYLTTKLPIYDRNGKIIGLMGVNQLSHEPIASSPETVPDRALSNALELIRQNPDRRVTTEEMARATGMSVWQLRRRFRKTFGKTPHEFERASRIQQAAKALANSEASLASIAIDFGFCDQSAFSVQFRKEMGCSPKKYRDKQK